MGHGTFSFKTGVSRGEREMNGLVTKKIIKRMPQIACNFYVDAYANGLNLKQLNFVSN